MYIIPLAVQWRLRLRLLVLSLLLYFFTKGVFVLNIAAYADEVLKNDKSKTRYPIWYYKKLSPISIDTVVFKILSERFVVEIDSVKYGLEFYRSEEYGMQMKYEYDDLADKKIISSHEILEKAFREGAWYQVLKSNTSKEFKEEYREIRYEKEKNDLIRFLSKMLDKDNEAEIEN